MLEIRSSSARVSRELMEAFARFDTATLYESAGQKGMVDPAIRPVWPGARLCGPALTVRCPPRDNLMLYQAVSLAEPGDILVTAADGFLLAGAWGEVLTVAAQARGIGGLVIDGATRDTDAIAGHGFPVFSRGRAIGACTKERQGTINEPLVFCGVRVRPGDLVVGDMDGVVVIDRDQMQQVLDAATERRRREQALMEELLKGKTALELLGLPTAKKG